MQSKKFEKFCKVNLKWKNRLLRLDGIPKTEFIPRVGKMEAKLKQ